MSKYILIVDDDLSVGATISMLVKSAGFEISYFSDPQLLLEALPKMARAPDLLITDYRMPYINGLELIQLCRAALPKLKTISVSGALSITEIDKYPLKPDAVLLKPFGREDLLNLINSLLQ